MTKRWSHRDRARRVILAVAFGLPAIGSAAAIEHATSVSAGETILLGGFALDSGASTNCASQPGRITVVEAPRGGSTTQSVEKMVLWKKVRETSGNDCLEAKKDATALRYTARSDFRGIDRLAIKVRFHNGEVHEFRYSIRVDPPEREAAARPAGNALPIDPPTSAAVTTARENIARAAREAALAIDKTDKPVAPSPPGLAPPETRPAPSINHARPPDGAPRL